MDLKELRVQIDEIDRQMVDLFDRRMRIAAGVAQYKKENGIPILDEGRERAKLGAVAAMANEDMADYTRMLYNYLMDMSRAYQDKLMHPEAADCPLWSTIARAIDETPKCFPGRASAAGRARVACQGTWGAYSQHAADKLFSKPQIDFVPTFDDVFTAVEEGRCDYGIVPAENNTAGSVRRVYDLMTEKQFRIVRAVRVKIDHSLLVNPGTRREDIAEIVSHEQALAQCADYLRRSFPNAKITARANTALSAEYAAKSGRHDIAAIASPDCAQLYGLDCLSENIQISDNNRTRFFCISKSLEIYPGADRTSLMLRLPHEPGSLYRMLARFNAHGINLLKLESRPIPSTDFSVLFCFELETSVYADEFAALIRELSDLGDDMRYLGSYSEVQ
ncbi:MAG: bifunctional chorismate mutase/prephenate dehydratase [Ruminococcaceae bacterium]|nr:bifunctional chorismate mutase/prephenate dehydratase [Oscillospiraceae bacterium]